jgi:crotonobetainyl-CoA:carnitine CoA-transferase CaiB-like acyl-CoA transferase
MFSRAENADAMYPLIELWTMEHGKMEIMERCQANGVPVSAVFTVGEAADHEHLRARGYIIEQRDQTVPAHHWLLSPIRQSGAAPVPAAPARAQ